MFLFSFFFFCAGVVYSGEYDVCDVTLSVLSTPGELEKELDSVPKYHLLEPT